MKTGVSVKKAWKIQAMILKETQLSTELAVTGSAKLPRHQVCTGVDWCRHRERHADCYHQD
jgi:hypothetical protein